MVIALITVNVLCSLNISIELKQAHTIFYAPFDELEATGSASTNARLEKLIEIQGLLDQQRWGDARQQSLDLIHSALEGIRYLQTWVQVLYFL